MKKQPKTEEEQVLERFMKEFFPFTEFKKIGVFKPEMKNDYKAQAGRICQLFGYKTVYEYGAQEIHCHLSYVKGARPEGEGFVTTIPSIYE